MRRRGCPSEAARVGAGDTISNACRSYCIMRSSRLRRSLEQHSSSSCRGQSETKATVVGENEPDESVNLQAESWTSGNSSSSVAESAEHSFCQPSRPTRRRVPPVAPNNPNSSPKLTSLKPKPSQTFEATSNDCKSPIFDGEHRAAEPSGRPSDWRRDREERAPEGDSPAPGATASGGPARRRPRAGGMSHSGFLALLLVALCLALGSGWPHLEQEQQDSPGQTLKSASSGATGSILGLTLSVLSALSAVPVALAKQLKSPVRLARAQQYRPEWPSKSMQQEIFLLNLEDGYFGCQVNESQDFLQLFELSRLCDGQAQCYLGTDEMAAPLKCNNRDRCGSYQSSRGRQESIQCVNGVCLDGLCYCNDGFGGKACDVPDENECKFRPCDVFAHCTNTMGSYYCSCFPGYDGDGMHCQDINECEIPSLAALCSDNSECCNLPGHFVCKCKPGYQQSGQSSLTDIDECLDERACGKGATCENLSGSFRCSCPPGFTGDPNVECTDMDECRTNPCGVGAQCTNIPGGYRCSCAPGFERNHALPAAHSNQTMAPGEGGAGNSTSSSALACLDVNECLLAGSEQQPICGTGAQCVNTPGGYFCQCPPNYTGNPKVACTDIDECANHACGPNAQCKNTPGSYKCECKPGYAGNAYLAEGCQDEDECLRENACGLNAQCFNTLGSFQCSCLSGFSGDPYTRCSDIDECSSAGAQANPCGPGAQCTNLPGSYKCTCPDKFSARGTPEMGCERAAVDIGCLADADCTQNALCFNSTCQCRLGYQTSGIDCVDIDECALASQLSAGSQQPAGIISPIKAFTKLSAALNSTSAAGNTVLCGPEALCQNTDGSYKCQCKPGYEKLEPSSPQSKCRDINECEAANRSPCGQNSKCFNSDGSFKCACNEGFIPIDQEPANGCKSPCDGVNCGQHATCKPHGEEAACVCKPGFTFDPNNIKLGCVDINECDTNYGPAGLCGQRAQCTNVPGSYRCHCPTGYTGDAYRYCEDINECDRKFGVFGQCGELAVCNNSVGSYICSCAPGYTGDPRVKCTDIDECSPKSGAARCGPGAICTNLPGKFTCRCPHAHTGDPYSTSQGCQPEQPACVTTIDCGPNFVCQAGRCQCPFTQISTTSAPGASSDAAPASLECRHPCDKTECGAHATCQLDNENQALCVCDAGYMAPGDGRSGCVDVNECIQGVTLSGITPISALTLGAKGGSVALGPTTASPAGSSGAGAASNGSHPCGRNALCRNQPGSFDCVCPPGYSGNAYESCIMETRNQQQQQTTTTTATSTSTTGSSVTRQPQTTPAALGGHVENYQQEPRTTTCGELCPRGHACSDGQCVRPDSCLGNQDCRPHQSCEHVNQLLGYQCVNVCELSQCGPAAKCTPSNHKPICSCNSSAGFAGDPYDLISGCQLQSAYEFNVQTSTTSSTSFSSSSSSASASFGQQQAGSQGSGGGLTTSKHAETSLAHDSYKQTTASQQQQSDISTVSFDFGGSIGDSAGQAQQAAVNDSSLEQQPQRQQGYEYPQQQSDRKRPSQPLIAYELPLPTTPMLPQFSSGYTQQQQQQQNATIAQLQQQLAEQAAPRQPAFNQQQQQPSTSQPPLAPQTTTASRQQQSSTTQNLFSQKRKHQQQQQQQQQQSNLISNGNQANRQDADSSKVKGFEQQREQLQQQKDIAQGFGQLSNKSALITSYVFTHRQLSCTSDQHCPGNLYCLAGAEHQPKLNQKVCGCPSGYRREADYCFMHRINCTSSSLCKAREECISSAVLQQYYSANSLQTATTDQAPTMTNQQFSLQSSLGDEYTGICVCPRGYKLTGSGIACIDRNECDEGTPCAVGAVCQNKIGSYECVCPPGTTGEPYTKTCEPIVRQQQQAQQVQQPFECSADPDCPSDSECDLALRKCISPCHSCGPRAVCTAVNHAATCLCPPRFTGNPLDLVHGCQEPPTTPTTPASLQPPVTTQQQQASTVRPQAPPASTTVGVPVTTLLPPATAPPTTSAGSSSTTVAPAGTTTPEMVEFRTIPPSELFVMCLADGIQVEVQLGGFDGIIYVKGHSQDPKCRKLVMSSNANEFVDFKVQFGHCDLIHRDGEAGFVLVIQKHPKLVTYRARAYHVKCVYNTGERTVTLGFNVSMITTSGTIANTGPPPTCLMSITALDGREVTSAEIGQDLLLRVDVQPDSIYGGFARSCEAKTMDDEGEYQYEVTDTNGCATDPSIFSDWKYDQHRKSLVARFNAFKFPSSNNLRFQCNIRVCFGSCPAVNCNGVDAYGKRRRRRDTLDSMAIEGPTGNKSNEEPLSPADELIVTDAFKEGALREEIMVQSNAILTFDRKEASLPQHSRPQVEDIEFVCLPRLGIVMSIVLTTLLALFVLAILTSCWCFAKRKRRTRDQGPLPHPADFPNPLLRSPGSKLREPIYGP